MAKHPVYRLGAVLAFAACVSGCREPNQFAPPPPPKVTVATPLVQSVVTYTEVPGQTRALKSVEVRARVEGFLQSVDFEEGSDVAEGDLLYTIEPERYEAAVKNAEARLADAKAVLSKAQFDRDRMKELESKGAASAVEIIETETDLSRAKADKMAAEAALESAELDLAYTKITAPIAGRINRTEVDVGNLVGRGDQTLLTTIVPWNPIHVYANASERDVLKWRRRTAEGKQRINVPVYLRLADGADYPTPGVIDYIDNQVDVQTGTIRVRALFYNPEGLLVPGLFVRVRIPSEPTESVLIPESALQRDLTGYFVFAVTENQEAARMDVEAGARVETYRSITDGLPGSERVIIKGIQRVQPGMKVTVETVELPPVEQVSPKEDASNQDESAPQTGEPN